MPRLKPGQKPTSKDDRTIDRAIARLAHEAYHLREDFAALKVIELAGFRSAFMAVTVAAYQSDMLVRLMRVLERDARVGSFWFLSDCGLVKAERDRINRLKSLSKRLLAIRNGTFLHIDERELFDPQRVYRKKKIKCVQISSQRLTSFPQSSIDSMEKDSESWDSSTRRSLTWRKSSREACLLSGSERENGTYLAPRLGGIEKAERPRRDLNHPENRKNLNDFVQSVAGNSPIRVSLNTGVQTQNCCAPQ
ncbi:MAG: hypothetical protein WBQ86_04850 [Candidatus Binatus sp.]